MTTDDRDMEPSNPSKSFKVGEFDRLSGFFTPVWESKRKIRSESPVPSSNTAAGAPSSVKAPDSSKSSKPSSAPISTAGKARENTSPAGPPPAAASDTAEPTQQAATNQAPAVTIPAAGAQLSPGTPGVAVRPVIPMPITSPHLAAARAKRASKPPSAASVALEQAGPNLGPEAYLDQEPEFRPPLASPAAPAREERGDDIRLRSLRASAAATAVHDKLKAKLQTDSADTNARHRETDSDREAVRALEARAVALSSEPYPLHLLRRLRRTIHLSMPLPESVRSLLGKYRRN